MPARLWALLVWAEHVAVMIPDPRYVRTDDGTYLAYQVVGDGPVDIAWQHGQNLDSLWESAYVRAWLGALASFGRLILHDRRATGLSSRNVDPPNLETRAADLLAVLDAAGSRRTVIGGWFEDAAPGVLLAATDPDRVRGLVWWNPTPRTTWAHDYPWGWGPEQVEAELAGLQHWGTERGARRGPTSSPLSTDHGLLMRRSAGAQGQPQHLHA